MNSPLSRSQNTQRQLNEKDLEEMHHNMMVLYGWIPLDEFKSLPLPTLFGLHNRVINDLNKIEEMRLLTQKFYGVKNPK